MWRLFTPLGCVVLLAGLLVPFHLAYLLAQRPPGPLNQLVFAYAMPVAVVGWMIDDARRRKITPCYDLGLFALLTWPLSLVGYCVWTRRSRGLLLALGLWSLGFSPKIMASVWWTAFYLPLRLLGIA